MGAARIVTASTAGQSKDRPHAMEDCFVGPFPGGAKVLALPSPPPRHSPLYPAATHHTSLMGT